MKPPILILLILLIFTGSVNYAQEQENDEYDIMEYITSNNLSFTILNEPYSQIEGDPYLSREFDKGSVVMNSRDVLNGIFRWDLYADAVQFMYEGEIGKLNFPEKISMINLDGNIIKYVDYSDKGLDKSGYFIFLIDNHISLYLKKERGLMAEKIAKAMQQASPAKFLDKKDTYYLMIGQDPAVKVTNKKTLLNLFPDHSAEISEQLKREKIHFKNQEDLVQLVNYLNEIMVKNKTPID